MKICRVEKKREVVDVEYEVCDNTYCCKTMEKWLAIKRYGSNNLKYDTNTGRFNICVKESEESYNRHGSSEDYTAKYEDLNFCPFCGARLQESIVKKPKKKSWRKKK